MSQRLNPGQRLNSGQDMVVGGGLLRMQTDGNLVVYKGHGVGAQALWWSNTAGHPGAYLEMQTDGNLVIYAPPRNPLWSSSTNGHPGAYAEMQDDGNFVVYAPPRSALWSTTSAGWNPVDMGGGGGIFSDIIGAITSPLKSATSKVASAATGRNITVTSVSVSPADIAKAAQSAISFVPGIGSGVNAAIAAGAALAQGENITDAMVDAAKNAVPGGPIAAQGFEAGYKMVKAAASGQNIGEAALAAAREALPNDLAKRAFDTGLAIAHGQNVQQSLTNAAAGIVSNELNNAVSSLSNVALPAALTNVAKSLPPEVTSIATAISNRPELQGLPIEQIAKALGANQTTVTQAVQVVGSAWQKLATLTPEQKKRLAAWVALSKLTPEQQQQLKAMVMAHPPTLHTLPAPVVVSTPTPAIPPAIARTAYAPYPSMRPGTVSAPRGHRGGGGWHPSHHPAHPDFHPARVFRGGHRAPGWWWDVPWSPDVIETTCTSWGDRVDMPPSMETAARVAVNSGGGRPATVRGPDGVLYLFALENGVLTARRCASTSAA